MGLRAILIQGEPHLGPFTSSCLQRPCFHIKSCSEVLGGREVQGAPWSLLGASQVAQR